MESSWVCWYSSWWAFFYFLKASLKAVMMEMVSMQNRYTMCRTWMISIPAAIQLFHKYNGSVRKRGWFSWPLLSNHRSFYHRNQGRLLNAPYYLRPLPLDSVLLRLKKSRCRENLMSWRARLLFHKIETLTLSYTNCVKTWCRCGCPKIENGSSPYVHWGHSVAARR